MKVKTISAADTAFLLRAKIGPLRAWSDFLTDNIRGRQDVFGFTLPPACDVYDGRAYRPRYSLKDVNDFIKDVLAHPSLPTERGARVITVDLDLEKPPFMRRYNADGSPRPH